METSNGTKVPENGTKVPEVNRPEKKFSTGAISAAVWRNNGVQDGQVTEYRSVTLQRSFKDKAGKWQTTTSLRVNDLPKAALVLSEAYKFLVMRGDEAVAS
jgi:hypothetical protein